MARSTLSLGMLAERAARMSLRNRKFPSGSPPPVFAAIEISFDSLLKILPRLASMAPLKRFTFDHLLCPAINSGRNNFCESSPGQKSVDFGKRARLEEKSRRRRTNYCNSTVAGSICQDTKDVCAKRRTGRPDYSFGME